MLRRSRNRRREESANRVFLSWARLTVQVCPSRVSRSSVKRPQWRYPPAMAPTMKNGSAPRATASGKVSSGAALE